MQNSRLGSLIYHAIRYGLAGVFLYSGASHASNGYIFVQSIDAYRLVQFEIAVWIAAILPLVQITSGFFLLVEFWVGKAFAATSIMLVVFLFAGITAAIRGLDISCGCFGNYSPKVTWSHVLLCAGMLFASLFAMTVARNRNRFAGPGEI